MSKHIYVLTVMDLGTIGHLDSASSDVVKLLFEHGNKVFKSVIWFDEKDQLVDERKLMEHFNDPQNHSLYLKSNNQVEVVIYKVIEV